MNEIGYIYCLSNPAMPGLVKIGYTNRNTHIRIEELSFGTKDTSATGVPVPFEKVKEWKVPADKSEVIEQQIHKLLDLHRVPKYGRTRAKEFFYLTPTNAVILIENAFRSLDWWNVSQAEVSKIEIELQERSKRRAAEILKKKLISEQERKIRQEIKEKQENWRIAASKSKESQGFSEGMKWGAVWFFGSALFFAAIDAKEAALWLCLLFAVIAFYMTRDTPATAYLSSKEAKDELQKIELEIMKYHEFKPGNFFCPMCKTPLTLPEIPSIRDVRFRCKSCAHVFVLENVN